MGLLEIKCTVIKNRCCLRILGVVFSMIKSYFQFLCSLAFRSFDVALQADNVAVSSNSSLFVTSISFGHFVEVQATCRKISKLNLVIFIDFYWFY